MNLLKKCVRFLCTMSLTLSSLWVLPATIASAATLNSPTVSVAVPVRLVIPSLHIDANVDTLGITHSGHMAAPNNFSNVGWYKYSSIPGEIGNTIIDGHYESGTNARKLPTPGVFQNLHMIQMGDDIQVLSANGTTHHYTVVSLTLMNKDASITPVMTSNGTSRLVLITCAGTWLPQQGTFSERLIVTAVLE